LTAVFEDSGQEISSFGVIPIEIFPNLLGTISAELERQNKSSDSVFYLSTRIEPFNIFRTNFGFWDEWIVEYNTTVSGNDLGNFIDVKGMGANNGLNITFIAEREVGIEFAMPANSTAAIITIDNVYSEIRFPQPGGYGSLPISVSTAYAGVVNMVIGGLNRGTSYNIRLKFINDFTETNQTNLTFRTASIAPIAG
jgi:hypothetical protein